MSKPTVVIENGSGVLKAGNGGMEAPEFTCRALVGRPRPPCPKDSDIYIGAVALEVASVTHMRFPTVGGIITHWDDVEELWRHAFTELKADAAEHWVFMVDTFLGNKDLQHTQREKMAQIMYETFSVPAFHVEYSTVTTLYSTGRTTGVVLECGEDVTTTCAMYEGYPIKYTACRRRLGGRDVTSYLQELLNENGHLFWTRAETEVVRELKEKCAYVALNFDKEIEKAEKGSTCKMTCAHSKVGEIELNKERFCCTELLFKPHLNGLDGDGVSDDLFLCCRKCHDEVRPTLYSNIVLSGGTTTLPGFPERIEREMLRLAPSTANIQVVESEFRQYGPWIGGSKLSQLPTFQHIVVTRAEYNESGAAKLAMSTDMYPTRFSSSSPK